MSFRLVASVLDDKATYGFGSTRLLVLVILASWANDDGEVVYGKASVGSIAAYARIKERRCEQVLAELHKGGYIDRVPVPGRVSTLRVTPPQEVAGVQESAGVQVLAQEIAPPVSNSKGVKGENPQEDEDLTAATAGEEERAARDASPKSPPPPGGVLDGNPEIGVGKESYYLSVSAIRGKMNKARAKPWEIDRVTQLPKDERTAAYYEWDQTRQLPERGSTVQVAGKPPAQQRMADALARIQGFGEA